MLPYAANDMLNVMRHEMEPEVERRHGAQIARDVTRTMIRTIRTDPTRDSAPASGCSSFKRHSRRLTGSSRVPTWFDNQSYIEGAKRPARNSRRSLPFRTQLVTF